MRKKNIYAKHRRGHNFNKRVFIGRVVIEK